MTGPRVLVSNLVFWANSEDTALRSSTFAALLQCCNPVAERAGPDGKGPAGAEPFEQIVMGIIMQAMRRSLQFGSTWCAASGCCCWPRFQRCSIFIRGTFPFVKLYLEECVLAQLCTLDLCLVQNTLMITAAGLPCAMAPTPTSTCSRT